MSERPLKILCVCLGNICRSPTAEALLRHRLEERGVGHRFEIRSAGIIARGNDVATIEAVRVAAARGVDMRDHLSTPLTAELIESSDLVVAMDRLNVEYILNLVPDLGPRLRLLSSFARGDDHQVDVHDPIGDPIEVYEQTYDQIEAGVDGLVEELTATLAGAPDRSAGTAKES